MTSTISFALALLGALSLWDGTARTSAVEGPRPRAHVEQVLAKAGPAFAECVRPDPQRPAHVVLTFKVHAAGIVDEILPFDVSTDAAGTLDVACFVRAVRALRFADRGHEPGTRVTLLFAASEGGAQPGVVVPRDAADALAVVRDDLRICRDRELPRAPSLAGTVIARMRTDEDGWVVEARVAEGTLANERARACMRARLERVRFVQSAEWSAGAGQAAQSVAWVFAFPPVERSRATGLYAPTLFACLGIGG